MTTRSRHHSLVRVVVALALTIAAAACARDQTAPPTTPTPMPTSTPIPRPMRALTIAGTLRAVNGGPLVGAAVLAWSQTRGIGSQVASTTADGSFRLEQFADDGFVIRAQEYNDVSWIV